MGCLQLVGASGIRQPVLTYSRFTFTYHLKTSPAGISGGGFSFYRMVNEMGVSPTSWAKDWEDDR